MLGVSASADVAPSGPPTSTGTGGAAASVERLATQAAIDELKAGGNAIDAAVAAAGVLGVTEPFSCGIGGGGFMVIRTADGQGDDDRRAGDRAGGDDADLVLGERRAAAVQRRALERDVRGRPGHARDVGRKRSRSTARSRSRRRCSRASASRANGFVVDQTFFDQTQAAVPWFDDIPATAALFLDPDGTPHDVGTVFRNPDLARAYERIAHLGAKGLYRGAIADAIVDTVQHPESSRRRPTTSGGRA